MKISKVEINKLFFFYEKSRSLGRQATRFFFVWRAHSSSHTSLINMFFFFGQILCNEFTYGAALVKSSCFHESISHHKKLIGKY